MHGIVTRRRSPVQRSFGFFAVTALVVVGTLMGTSFLATTRAQASPTARTLVMLGPAVTPAAGLEGLRYSRAREISGRRLISWQRPALSSGTAIATVSRSGDLVFVDTRTRQTPLRVDLYVTNGAALARSYSSFVLPVALWRSGQATGPNHWTRSTAAYLTNSGGEVNFVLPAGAIYDITIERGGSFYPLPGRPALAPTFFARS